MNYKPNLYDKLFVCIYVFMRHIKKERENLTIASTWLGICSALNINTIIGCLLLLLSKNPNWGIVMFIPFIFFYNYLRRYYLFSGYAVRLTENLAEVQMGNKKILIAIAYSFLSFFSFWGVLFFIHWIIRIM